MRAALSLLCLLLLAATFCIADAMPPKKKGGLSRNPKGGSQKNGTKDTKKAAHRDRDAAAVRRPGSVPGSTALGIHAKAPPSAPADAVVKAALTAAIVGASMMCPDRGFIEVPGKRKCAAAAGSYAEVDNPTDFYVNMSAAEKRVHVKGEFINNGRVPQAKWKETGEVQRIANICVVDPRTVQDVLVRILQAEESGFDIDVAVNASSASAVKGANKRARIQPGSYAQSLMVDLLELGWSQRWTAEIINDEMSELDPDWKSIDQYTVYCSGPKSTMEARLSGDHVKRQGQGTRTLIGQSLACTYAIL